MDHYIAIGRLRPLANSGRWQAAQLKHQQFTQIVSANLTVSANYFLRVFTAAVMAAAY